MNNESIFLIIMSITLFIIWLVWAITQWKITNDYCKKLDKIYDNDL